MVDYWGIYHGKSREELNPHRLRWGDWVIAPDGTKGRLDRPGFKWGYLEGCDRAYPLVELKPLNWATFTAHSSSMGSAQPTEV